MQEFNKVNDSGKHRDFPSGAKRDNKESKGRYDLLPPFAIHRLARHFQNGAIKYNPRNWEKGIPTSEYVDSGIRHLFGYLSGEDTEDHLSAAIWNLSCLIDTQERVGRGILPPELDDIGIHIKETFHKQKPHTEEKIEGIFTTSEKLTTEQLDTIRKQFEVLHTGPRQNGPSKDKSSAKKIIKKIIGKINGKK